jgi:hypothetical protein
MASAQEKLAIKATQLAVQGLLRLRNDGTDDNQSLSLVQNGTRKRHNLK